MYELGLITDAEQSSFEIRIWAPVQPDVTANVGRVSVTSLTGKVVPNYR